MKRHLVFLLSLVLLAAAGGCASRTSPSATPAMPAEPVDLETQLVEYVEVQEALAADSFEEAKTQLEEFTRVTAGVTRALAEAAQQTEDIEEMRAKFKPLSDSFAETELPQGFARAYCPMYDNGASWVQRDGPVRNPYYGAIMLTCGVVDAAAGAHMDHTPRHGGTVFMAPDSFHHIEGTYPEPGVFRLYATDNYRAGVDMTDWAGRAVTDEEYDEDTDEFVEVTAFDLVLASSGEYLEARVPGGGGPMEVTAMVIFQSDFPAERFDFIFAELSSTDSAVAAEAVTADAVAGAGGSFSIDGAFLAQQILPDIPADAGQVVVEIASRDQIIQDLIARGGFTEIFIPALQAKELALALQAHGSEISEDARNQVRIAVRQLVRAAYMLDWYGDLGNKNDVDTAYDIFGTAVGQLSDIYAVPATP